MAYELEVTQLVADNLPAGFSVSTDFIAKHLKTWQLLLYRAAEIPEDLKYDISVWSDEWRLILAYCIIYDLYMNVLSGNYILVGSSETNTSTGGGTVKKITTGPTEVEYHNDSSTLAMLLKDWDKPGGLLYLLFAKACMAASLLGVKLPFCAAYKGGTTITVVNPGKEKRIPCVPCTPNPCKEC